MNNEGNKMFCSNCGTPNDRSSAFCKNCGNRLSEPTVQNASATTQTATTNAAAPYTSASRAASAPAAPKITIHPVLDSIKKMALSPLCLITALAFSLMIVFYISNADMITTIIMEALSTVLDQAGAMSSYMDIAFDAVSDLTTLVAFLAMLPNIIIAIGIWCTIYSAYSNKKTISTGGLRTIRVVVLIQYILEILSVIAYIFLCIDLFIKISNAEVSAKVSPLALFVLFLVFAALIFRVYVLYKMKELIDELRYNIDSPRSPFGPSLFVAVMTFISCGGYLISAFMSGALSDWFGAVAFLGFGLLIINFRTKMHDLQYEARNFEDGGNKATDYSTSNSETKSKTIAAIVIAVAVVAAIIGFASLYTSPNIDKGLVGVWEYEDNEESIMEFKRNGTYILNAGTEYEERGTYTAKDGVVTVITDDGINEIDYQIINKNKLKMRNSSNYWNSSWNTFYRVD